MSSGLRLREKVAGALLRAKHVGPAWARPDENDMKLRCLWAVAAVELGGADGGAGTLALVEETQGGEPDYYVSWLATVKQKPYCLSTDHDERCRPFR